MKHQNSQGIYYSGKGIFFHQYQIKDEGLYWSWPTSTCDLGEGFQPAVYFQPNISHWWGTARRDEWNSEVTLGWKERLGWVKWHISETAIPLKTSKIQAFDAWQEPLAWRNGNEVGRMAKVRPFLSDWCLALYPSGRDQCKPGDNSKSVCVVMYKRLNFAYERRLRSVNA